VAQQVIQCDGYFLLKCEDVHTCTHLPKLTRKISKVNVRVEG